MLLKPGPSHHPRQQLTAVVPGGSLATGISKGGGLMKKRL
jgi:hypothetical protein